MDSNKKFEIKGLLEPYHDVLGQIPLRAWEEWKESTEFIRSEHGRTRASVVWERMVAHGRNYFDSDPDWSIITHFGTVSFILKEKILLRFKKANNAGISSNYPTQLALAYHDLDQMGLFGMPQLHRIEIVYIINALETKIDDVRVVARNGDTVTWSYSIMPQADIIDTDHFRVHVTHSATDLVRSRIPAVPVKIRDEQV